MILERKGGFDEDDEGGEDGKVKELEDKLLKLSEVLSKASETSEEAHLMASTLKKVHDIEKEKKKGSIEEEVETLRERVADIYAGHQTLSSSVHRVQRSTNELLEKPDTGEELAKIQGKLTLLWKNKADKDEVDRAITRAVDTVMRSIPEPPGESDGTLIGKRKLQCLSCDRLVSKVSAEEDLRPPKPFRQINSDLGRLRSPELLFGGGLSSASADRHAKFSGLNIPLQTDRLFPYSTLHQSGANTERDLVGDLRARAPVGSNTGGSAHPRQQRLAASRGPGGFKPTSTTSTRRAVEADAIDDGAFDVQVKLQQGFKGKKHTGSEEMVGGGWNIGSNSKMGTPMIPVPPLQQRPGSKSKSEVGAWDNAHGSAGPSRNS